MKLSVRPISQRGFSLIELMVVVGIPVILASILLPYVASVRESSRRLHCQDNLRTIQEGLTAYARDNQNSYPRVRYDQTHKPNGYTAFTGADDANPFAADSAVRPNDVTASLWLLVRGGYVKNLRSFICPSTSDRPDVILDEKGVAVEPMRRGNFRSVRNLSYSYASPFSQAQDYRLNDTQPAAFAVLADKNPGAPAATSVAFDAPRLEQVKANSRNHDGAGQNVLYADGHVDFVQTAYCGYGRDNIYTALSASPLHGQKPAVTQPGYVSRDIGPSWQGDSYLVPTE